MRAAIAALLLFAGEAGADAAIKAQEGSVEHWIDYYARERAKPPAAATPQPREALQQPAAQDGTAGPGTAPPGAQR